MSIPSLPPKKFNARSFNSVGELVAKHTGKHRLRPNSESKCPALGFRPYFNTTVAEKVKRIFSFAVSDKLMRQFSLQ